MESNYFREWGQSIAAIAAERPGFLEDCNKVYQFLETNCEITPAKLFEPFMLKIEFGPGKEKS